MTSSKSATPIATKRADGDTNQGEEEGHSIAGKRDWRVTALGAAPFVICHLVVLGAFFIEISWTAWALCIALYFIRMWGVTAGYHRYFSHRAYRTSRVFQFMLACLAQSSAQKGVLWWGAHHRRHHKHSDQEQDLHSPVQRGFWYSHLGWLFEADNQDTDESRIGDFARYPELRWLSRLHLLPAIALGVVCAVFFGLDGLLIGFFLSTVLLWHGTFLINSLAHVYGTRRYATSDDSRNNLLLSLITLGEGWHNNHHRYQASARNGFFAHEVDFTYYGLVVLSWFGIVWDLRPVPESILEEGLERDRKRQKGELEDEHFVLPGTSEHPATLAANAAHASS